MGRIKSTMIKKAARQLLEGEHQFNEEFHHNKRLLGSTMPSKPMRNKIAGYISRLVKMRRLEQIKLSTKPTKVAESEMLQAEQY